MSSRRLKRRHEQPHNQERWVVSYADFITLLFAFFVVMYAISSVNEGKYRVLSNAIHTAFGRVPGPPPVAVVTSQPVVVMPAVRGDSGRARRDERQLKEAADRLGRALAPLVEQGVARISVTPQGTVVEIGATVLFSSAEAKLAPTAIPHLRAVAAVLADLANPLQVEGHTDSVPIATAQFPSNWELAAARAAAVARLFIDAGVAAPRISVLGYADTRPVVDNETAEGRARNRRVNLLVLARDAGPAAVATGGDPRP